MDLLYQPFFQHLPFPLTDSFFFSFFLPLCKNFHLFLLLKFPWLYFLLVYLFLACFWWQLRHRWSNYYRILCPAATHPLPTVQRTCEFLDLPSSLSSVSSKRPLLQAGEQSKQDGFGLPLLHVYHLRTEKIHKGIRLICIQIRQLSKHRTFLTLWHQGVVRSSWWPRSSWTVAAGVNE